MPILSNVTVLRKFLGIINKSYPCLKGWRRRKFIVLAVRKYAWPKIFRLLNYSLIESDDEHEHTSSDDKQPQHPNKVRLSNPVLPHIETFPQ